MSSETQESVIGFFATQMNKVLAHTSEPLLKASVSWYGGEPLLAKDIVLNMSQRMRKVAERIGGAAEFLMVSNCSLMDRSTAKALSDVGLKSVQVSFDALHGDALYPLPTVLGARDRYGIAHGFPLGRDKVEAAIAEADDNLSHTEF